MYEQAKEMSAGLRTMTNPSVNGFPHEDTAVQNPSQASVQST